MGLQVQTCSQNECQQCIRLHPHLPAWKMSYALSNACARGDAVSRPGQKLDHGGLHSFVAAGYVHIHNIHATYKEPSLRFCQAKF